MKRRSIFTFLTAAVIVAPLAGCGLAGGQRARVGYVPTATIGVLFADPDKLGSHASSGFGFGENGGIVYTCKAGHLDVDHIRGNADQMKYLVKKTKNILSKKRTRFSFSLSGEMSSHKITLTYPSDWAAKNNKEKIIDDVAFNISAYLVYNATIWHEFQTWFGVHFVGFEPEFFSAFSWEDTYSNLLGVHLGIEALKDTHRDFDDAMTIALNNKLAELEVQPRYVAVAASDKVRDTWYTGNLFIDTKMRNFDIGLDGYLTPTLIPGIDECNSRPMPLKVPDLKVMKRYGFSMYYEIKPNVFEQGRMFKAAGSKKIVPEIHYPVMLDYVKKEAIKKGYAYTE